MSWSRALLGALLMAAALSTSPLAHGLERADCVNEVAQVASHWDGDVEQIPDDSGGTAPHHHGGCHGHNGVAAVAVAGPRYPPASHHFDLPDLPAPPGRGPPGLLRPPAD